MVSLLGSYEIVGMGDILTWARKVHDRVGGGGTWLELDLCEMFMSIPRDRVLPALMHLFRVVCDRISPNCRPFLFSLSKDGN